MNNKNLDLFFDILSRYLESGLPLTECLSNLALFEDFDKKSSDDILKVVEEIRSGESFAKAMGKHINISDPVILKLIQIGEEKGLLSDFCKKISQGISFYDDISRFFFDFHLLLISGTQILEGLEICGD